VPGEWENWTASLRQIGAELGLTEFEMFEVIRNSERLTEARRQRRWGRIIHGARVLRARRAIESRRIDAFSSRHKVSKETARQMLPSINAVAEVRLLIRQIEQGV